MNRLVFAGSLSPSSPCGHLRSGGLVLRCAFGRSGRAARKREGDGATPHGRLRLLTVLYRADRVGRPPGRSVRRIRPDDGWCDSPADRNYNRKVQLPYTASAEVLLRDDGLYDYVGVLDYNLRPRVRGRGSAIFLHVARGDLKPTEGCIALSRRDLVRLLGWLAGGGLFVVGGTNRPRVSTKRSRTR